MSRDDEDAAETILVTGGAGFIGSHVVDRLLEAGHRVIVADDFSTGRRDNLSHHRAAERLRVVEVDVASDGAPALLDAAREGWGEVDRAVHLAAQVSVARSLDDPLEDQRVNARGTLAMVRYASARGVRSFVFASSAAVYGDDPPLPVTEDARLAPLSAYGIHKAVGEQYVRVWSEAHAFAGVALRFFNVYGPRQDPSSPYSGVISIFLDRARRGEALTVHGDGGQTRDFVYVADVVAAIEAALRRDAGPFVVANLGGGDELTIAELARAAAAATEHDALEIVHGPPRPGEIQRSRADIRRARAALGYAPAVALSVGLRRTLAWMASDPSAGA